MERQREEEDMNKSIDTEMTRDRKRQLKSERDTHRQGNQERLTHREKKTMMD